MTIDLLGSIWLGLSTALAIDNLIYCVIGVTLGMLVGVIPGIGAISAISMLFPITFYLDPIGALVMLGGIFYGSAYGGSTAAILLNLPGTPSSAITCIDGYPMSRQGRSGVALFMTAIASFAGASLGILILMLFSPVIVSFARHFGSAEYFMIMALGLMLASVISSAAPLKGIAAIFVGMAVGVVGTDIYTGTERYTFGILGLSDGVGLVALAMGLFGVSEVISSVGKVDVTNVNARVTLKSMIPTRRDWRMSLLPILRGSAIGSFIGTLPGISGTIAAFMAYAVEKKAAKEPERFGKGAIEGIVSPEAANNAADQTAFIPTLTLGIPGSATMALMLGVLMVHGITPGPSLITQNPELFWGLIMSFWIGNLLLLILNIPLIGLWIRILLVPYHILYPLVLIFVCVGVYIVSSNAVDVVTVLIFGAIGYLMQLFGFPAAPMLLGFVLGPMMEEHFRRAMILSDGQFSIFVSRPLSAFLFAVTLAVLLAGIWSQFRRRRQALL